METKQKTKKFKRSIFNYLEMGLYFFFMFFFIIYVGRYGLAGLILKGGSKHEIIFNIGVWFVLTTYCIDKFFMILDKK